MFWFQVPKKRIRGRHRRKRTDVWHHGREWVWPSMGLKPMLRWMELKIKRSPGTSYKAAMGAAIGVGICFTPFFGFHVILIFLLTRLLRASFLVGLIVSFVGNPWTFPFITMWTYECGHFLLGTNYTQPVLTTAPGWRDILQNIPYFWHNYIWPMTVGGIPSAFVAGTIVFFSLRGNIRRYQKARLLRLRAARKRHRDRMDELHDAEGKVHLIAEKLKEKSVEAAERLKERQAAATGVVKSILKKENDE